MATDQPKRFRNIASTMGILILLAGVLGFYYFKYVPERRAEFNRNAFLELGQIKTALQTKSQAYWDAFHTIVTTGKIDLDLLAQFNYQPVEHDKIDSDDEVQNSNFELDIATRRWNMVYRVVDKNSFKLACTLSKNSDTLMSELVSNYKDIFDGYVLIGKVRSVNDTLKSIKKSADTADRLRPKIIYHSDDLSTDYLVNPDSLLKKNEGVSMMNILDVTIAGNSYKLFLYPFEMGKQRLTLTGLISESNYRDATQKIPFTLFSVFIILLLLLIIHLPILRIYVLGPDERIRATDIRLIIGSYFIAAFFGFFLFSKFFLDQQQSIQNRKHLETLANKITTNFYDELGSIKQQLCFFDSTLESLKNSKSQYLGSLSSLPNKEDIDFLDKLFKPRIYPYSTGVFWISDSGRWVARWAFRRSQTNTKMIDVNDRSYYSDFKTGKTFSIPGKIDTFTIQPTLSKLEGEYIISVAKKSVVGAYQGTIDSDNRTIKPFLIGLSSKMYSVSNVIMPPGYEFSMIDGRGNVLFDSRDGRPLLSNILKEVENPDGIQQSAIYRNERYFEHLQIRSKDRALLSRPVGGTPYQLLVYYNRARSDGFEEHLIALSAGLMGIVICMVIFSALVNQWAKTKNRMLESRSQHLEWLHPSANLLKQKYYRHLIIGMLILFAIYLAAWVFMDNRLPGSEFSMLFISLLFPFYITLHYYELRERYYDAHEHRTGINWYFSRPSLALRCLLLFIIVVINSFVPFYKFSRNMALPVLLTQLFWAVAIIRSTLWFRKYIKGDRVEGIPACIKIPDKKETESGKNSIPVSYIWTILTGVALISCIPASGIFWLFFREETGLYQNADQLIIANQIDQRRQIINQYLEDYKFNEADSIDKANISDLKFSHGIYMLSGSSKTDTAGITYSPIHYPSADYIHLHEILIPEDSIAWTEPADFSPDWSWYFGNDRSKPNTGPGLVFSDTRDEINPAPFLLTSDSTAAWNTAGLLLHSFSGNGASFPIFFVVGLGLSLTIAYFLTLSLSKRIFLMELHIVSGKFNTKKNQADTVYERKNVSRDIKLLILKTCRQIREEANKKGESKKSSFVRKIEAIIVRTLGLSNGSSSEKENYNKPIYFPGFPNIKDIYWFEKKLPLSMLESKMPLLLKTMEPVYSELWKSLSPSQKFILFDFAQDGFSNYKAGKDLQSVSKRAFCFSTTCDSVS